MIYIVTALKPEAQAFVDKYKLKKIKVRDYSLFWSDTMLLIISGVGVTNARLATQALINLYDITDDDIYLNIGICAATSTHEIGALMKIDAILYEGTQYFLKEKQTHIITCLDEEAFEEKGVLVDMESFGFYDAVIHSPAIKNFFIFKVVSDHFQPHKVSKEGTKMLVFNVLEEIEKSLMKAHE